MNALSADTQIAVIGAGTMGAGIAQVAAHAGHDVLLYDAASGAAEKGIANVGEGLFRQVERGKLTTEQVSNILSRMIPVARLEDLSPAGLVIEAIIEDLQIKQDLFKSLEDICGDQTILASNTSSLSITAIGSALSRPQNFVGLHFFNPAQVMKLVEIISGSATTPDIAQTAFDTAQAWGKKPVHAASTPGFIVNRVARPFYAEALRVLEEGAADIATIDAIMKESAGFRMGPFELMDLIGNDVNLAVTKSVFKSYHYDPRFKPSLVQEDMVAAGKFGRKSGSGYYDYADGEPKTEAQTSPEMTFPETVSVRGDLGVATPLVTLIENAGIKVVRENSDISEGFFQVANAEIRLTNGSLATERGNNTIYFDLALDYEKASRIALAASDQCEPSAIEQAIGLFQALGKSVSVIDDIPAMIVMRSVCMLANEGADAVNQGVCNEEAVDTAMCFGVNYPEGPLQWADRIGLKVVENVLDQMVRVYGEPRYRCSPLIRRKALNGSNFRP
ncbi:MAG: 3-hydroxyacyl-CoA dehydrogenase PaaC [Rhodospirillales bacterium]|nr:3-hydroxyacyl-CoA dehydrogenase PaaC [Rhodospirillales bacterium]